MAASLTPSLAAAWTQPGAPISVGDGPFGIAATTTDLWVTNFFHGTVTRISPEGAVLRTFAVGDGAAHIAVDGTTLWITANGINKLVKVDSKTGAVLGTFDTDGAPYGVAWGPNGQVYVAASLADAVSRIARTAVPAAIVGRAARTH
ncbi:MAG: hypothetical protein H7138_25985 [Myxococcales bacterium]|nr:hypothetical protein [Myxococcales bacterium]